MSFGSRIKERRTALGLSRQDLANALGVTTTAIGNYETDYSTPKIELLYKMFDILQCDANYLYQDDMKAISFRLSSDESELIECYRSLNAESKSLALNTVLYLREREYMEDLISKANGKSKKGLA